MTGAATCASWKTPCTAPCCWRTRPTIIGPEAHPDCTAGARPRRPSATAGAAPWPRDAGRPHGRRCRARSDPGHAGPLPRQPHPCRQHPGHLDPHPAQQAEAYSEEGHARRRLATAIATPTCMANPEPTVVRSSQRNRVGQRRQCSPTTDHARINFGAGALAAPTRHRQLLTPRASADHHDASRRDRARRRHSSRS